MMTEEQKASILVDLKGKLQITWNSENDTRILSSLINDAEYVMNHKLGSELDYSEPGLFHDIFLNYCWYVRMGCSYEFDKAYKSEMIMLRNYCEVKRYEESNSEA